MIIYLLINLFMLPGRWVVAIAAAIQLRRYQYKREIQHDKKRQEELIKQFGDESYSPVTFFIVSMVFWFGMWLCFHRL